MSSPDGGVPNDLLTALDAATASSSRKLAERGAGPAFRLVREIGPKLQLPLVRPLLVAGPAESGWLVLEQLAADRFRLRWVAEDGMSSRTAAELARGNGDNDVEQPAAIAVDAGGNICLLDAASGRVRRFSPDGRWLETIAPLDPEGNSPVGAQDIAFEGQGRLIVADTNSDRVLWVAADGSVEKISDEGADLFEPRSVCAIDGESALVADTNNNCLAQVWTTGASQAIADSGGLLEFPSRVRLAAGGKWVAVLDKSGTRVQRFTLAGQRNGAVSLPTAGEAAGSSDLALDREGNAVLINHVRQSIVVLAFPE
jgi:sugar lactone lactonase YvrE